MWEKTHFIQCQNHKNNENFHFNNYLLCSHYFSSKNDKTNNYHNKNLSHLSLFLQKKKTENFKQNTLKPLTKDKQSIKICNRATTTTMVTHLLYSVHTAIAFIISQWKMKLITAHYLFTRLPLLCIICIRSLSGWWWKTMDRHETYFIAFCISISLTTSSIPITAERCKREIFFLLFPLLLCCVSLYEY